jgi:hypothetical protein
LCQGKSIYRYFFNNIALTFHQLQKADEIIAQLGTGADAVKAAQGLVAAEQNFNPFAVSIPSICSDPTLPKTEILRGIVPLVDPAVGGSALENANQAASLKAPFPATGMSVAQVMASQGFTNFTTKDLAGNVDKAPAAAVTPLAVPPPQTGKALPAVAGKRPQNHILLVMLMILGTPPCPTTMMIVTVTRASGAAPSTPAAAPAAALPTGSTGSTGSVQQSTIAGLDFGLCVPTMKFEAGLNGRKTTEFTFQAIDPLVNKGQEEALNPNIITNRICDQLTNVCNANAAAKAACQKAKTQISALGTRDVTTADAWNTALGFKGTNTNPDNAPQPGLVGHT